MTKKRDEQTKCELVGDVNADTQSQETRDEFLSKLKTLMMEYEIDKIDVGWARPKCRYSYD